MQWFEALILGIVQGLTEFLPVSSSGHLEIGKVLLGMQHEENITFTVVVHGATVLSTMVIFWKDIWQLIKGLLKFQWNEETKYAVKLIISAIPVAILGFLFKDEIEGFFTGNLILVGSMLIITALLLGFTSIAKDRSKDIPFLDAIIIGIAQAFAVMPGISRSGATIATGILLGNNKEKTAKFSFLMVLVPIIGANLKDLLSGDMATEAVSAIPLIIGFLAAFISGLLACRLMIEIVKRSKLIYFAIYCLVVGLVAISASLFFL